MSFSSFFGVNLRFNFSCRILHLGTTEVMIGVCFGLNLRNA